MKIIIFWEWEDSKVLNNKISSILEELGLNDFITLENSVSEELKSELKIEKNPALIIEEESIEFKDTIFEWIVPDEEELKQMIVSIIWWADTGWWCSTDSCGSCSCSC